MDRRPQHCRMHALRCETYSSFRATTAPTVPWRGADILPLRTQCGLRTTVQWRRPGHVTDKRLHLVLLDEGRKSGSHNLSGLVDWWTGGLGRPARLSSPFLPGAPMTFFPEQGRRRARAGAMQDNRTALEGSAPWHRQTDLGLKRGQRRGFAMIKSLSFPMSRPPPRHRKRAIAPKRPSSSPASWHWPSRKASGRP